jgi:hypothetical protein
MTPEIQLCQLLEDTLQSHRQTSFSEIGHLEISQYSQDDIDLMVVDPETDVKETIKFKSDNYLNSRYEDVFDSVLEHITAPQELVEKPRIVYNETEVDLPLFTVALAGTRVIDTNTLEMERMLAQMIPNDEIRTFVQGNNRVRIGKEHPDNFFSLSKPQTLPKGKIYEESTVYQTLCQFINSLETVSTSLPATRQSLKLVLSKQPTFYEHYTVNIDSVVFQ